MTSAAAWPKVRQQLQPLAPAAKPPAPVQANVEERKPSAVTPDKLTLSKGAVGAAGSASAAKASTEDAIAKDKQAKDAAVRTAELSKNIQDLNKLGGTSTIATGPTSTKAVAPAVAASAVSPGVAVAVGTPALPSAR